MRWMLPAVVLLVGLAGRSGSAQRWGRPEEPPPPPGLGRQYPVPGPRQPGGVPGGPHHGFPAGYPAGYPGAEHDDDDYPYPHPAGARPGPGLSAGGAPLHPPRGRGGGGSLGTPCDYDEDCYFMEHTYCRNQQACECKRDFVPSSSGDRCLATVGARCSTKYDCAGLGQSGDCRQGVCDCGNDYVPAPDGSCLKGARMMNDGCELDLQCEMLGDGAVCSQGRCQCAPGKHAFKDKCLANRALGEPCSETAECFVGEGYQSIITCRVGICRCMEHYVDDGFGKCKSGASIANAVLTATFLLALAPFLQ